MSQRRNEAHPLPEDLQKAFQVAEKIIRQNFFGVAGFASRTSKWRQGAMTDQQQALLLKLGVAEEILAGMSKGKASMLITQLNAIRAHEGGGKW